VLTVIVNTVAVWKQEPRNPAATAHHLPMPSFGSQWSKFLQRGRAKRLLVAVGLGSAAFALQDILLEPYGGEILHLTVGQTTFLMTLLSLGMLVGFGLAGRWLELESDPIRLSAFGLMIGVLAFSAVVFAAPLGSANLFRAGALMIGIGCGLFTVGTLTAAMHEVSEGENGLALGAWGAVKATAVGVAIAVSGALRDVVSHLAMSGRLGAALEGPATGYQFVYHLEIALLFASLIAIGPLVRRAPGSVAADDAAFDLDQQTV
jgi:BCD family chlorophyll transporter-like MFS transporter